jgi:hypothetical protein
MTTTAGTDYATTNWLGSVTGLISSAGTQVSSTTYTFYGTPAATGTPASPVGFAGSCTLPGSGGLDDMNARDYNPANGTFTSVDPSLLPPASPTPTPTPATARSPGPTRPGSAQAGSCAEWSMTLSVAPLSLGPAEFLVRQFLRRSRRRNFRSHPQGVAYPFPKGWTSRVTETEGESCFNGRVRREMLTRSGLWNPQLVIERLFQSLQLRTGCGQRRQSR